MLLDRAVIVIDALRLRGRRLRQFITLLYLVIVLGIPALFAWLYWVVYRGKVLIPEGNCVFYSVQDEESVLTFGAADVVLNIAMLTLFALPLNQHMRGMAADAADATRPATSMASPSEGSPRPLSVRVPWPGDAPPAGAGTTATQETVRDQREERVAQLRHVMVRNVLVSAVVSTTTVAGLSVLIGLLLKVHGTVVPRDEEYLQVWAVFAPNVDVFLSVLVLHGATSAWWPQRVREWAAKRGVFHKEGARPVENEAPDQARRVSSRMRGVWTSARDAHASGAGARKLGKQESSVVASSGGQ